MLQDRRAHPAVEQLILAKPRGFCAGVVMAIQAVETAAQTESRPLTVYHSIVHNHTVVSRLADGGVHFVENLDTLSALPAGSETLVFSAHGVSPAVRQRARDLGLSTIDATCPLVTKVHTEAKKYAREGYTILLIGDSARHQEVIGTLGEAPESTIIVGVLGKTGPGLHDPHTVAVPDPEKLVVLTQTTLSVDDTRRTVAILKARFPALVVPPSEDLCYATKNRQDEVRRIAPQVDAFLVLTSPHSSNGMRLLEVGGRTVPQGLSARDRRRPGHAQFERRAVYRHQQRCQHPRRSGAGRGGALSGAQPGPHRDRAGRVGEHHLPRTEEARPAGRAAPHPALMFWAGIEG